VVDVLDCRRLDQVRPRQLRDQREGRDREREARDDRDGHRVKARRPLRHHHRIAALRGHVEPRIGERVGALAVDQQFALGAAARHGRLDLQLQRRIGVQRVHLAAEDAGGVAQDD